MEPFKFGVKPILKKKFTPLTPGNLPSHEIGAELEEFDQDIIERQARPQTWSNCVGSSFQVRVGPDYYRHGRKEASNVALYKVCAVDVYRTSKKVSHFGRAVSLDKLEEVYQEEVRVQAQNEEKSDAPSPQPEQNGSASSTGDDSTNEESSSHAQSTSPRTDPSHNRASLLSSSQALPSRSQGASPVSSEQSNEDDEATSRTCASSSPSAKIPPWFIINVMIPDYTPSIVWKKDDGDGYSLVLYARLTEESRQLLEEEDPGHALRLLKRFILRESHPADQENCGPDDDPIIRKKFKVIARALNNDHADFNTVTRTMVSQYNAKPFLARTSPTFHSGVNYFEVSLDVHRFGTPARIGLQGVKQSLTSVVFDFGFVVECDHNDEMPENILACARMCKLSPADSTQLPKDIADALRA